MSSSSSSSNLNNTNLALIRCQICANSKDPQIPLEAQMIASTQLLNHVAEHFNYRPHKCTQCGFATIQPDDLVRHSQQTQHRHVQLFIAQNSFLEEICNVVMDECKRRNTQNIASDITGRSSIKKEVTHPINAPSPQSVSPIPSITPPEEQAQANNNQLRQQQQQFSCSSSDNNNDNNDQQLGEMTTGTSAASALRVKSSLAPVDVSENMGQIEQNCIERISQIFASAASNALMDVDSSPITTQQQAAELLVASPPVPVPALNVPLVSLTSTQPLQCLICGKITSNYATREYHCNTHLGLVLFRCRICFQDYKNNGWRNHIKGFHRIKNPHQGMVDRYDQNMERVKREARLMYAPVGNATALAPPNTIPAITPTQRSQQKVTAQSEQMGGGSAAVGKAAGGGGRANTAVAKLKEAANRLDLARVTQLLHRSNTNLPTQISTPSTVPSTSATVTSTSALTTVPSAPLTVPLSSSSSHPIIKSEFGVQPTQQTASNAKKKRTVLKVECAECGELVPDSIHSHLNHINAKHLKLWLYQCGVCHVEFMSTIAGHSHCKNHIRAMHRVAFDQALLEAPDLRKKMQQIRAQASRFFGN